MPADLGLDVRPPLLSIVYVVVCLLGAEVFNRVVDHPYLDEIFHVPQAQKYCNGDFDYYDPKLTTPPGLYFISLGLAQAVNHATRLLSFGGSKAACETLPQLRYTCLLSLLVLPWLLSFYKHQSREVGRRSEASSAIKLRQIIKPTSTMEAMTAATANPSKAAQTARRSVAIRQNQALSRRQSGIWGVLGSTLDSFHLTLEVHTLSLLPPLWFFGFLYYTDVPSTVLVMAMLCASKRDKNLLAALLGCASLTLRQTNVVWVLFAIGTSLLENLSNLGLSNTALSTTTSIEQLKSISNLPLGATISVILRVIAPYSSVAVLSGVFIVRNGRIVLGDQEHHQATLHWVQPLYCIAMLSIFAWPALLSSLRLSSSSPSRRLSSIPLLFLLTVVCLAAIHYGTIAHPFLLADNRHFTFYIWRKVVNRTPWMRYTLAPCYAVMLRVWWFALAQENSLFWMLGFLLCTCAAIVPSPLIEPRYFLIPYLIARLHLFSDSKEVDLATDSSTPERRQIQQSRRIHLTALIAEGCWYAIINAVTIYLFVYRPFHWPDSTHWQRFMW